MTPSNHLACRGPPSQIVYNSFARSAPLESSPSRPAPTFADFVYTSFAVSHFLNVDPTYDDAPPAYIAFEANDTLVGTDAGASAGDCSDVNDYASSLCDTPRASYTTSEPNNSPSVSDTNGHASGDDYRGVNAARYAFGICGGD
ncbi:hypothetical protein B0H15DRAFT_945824 [Mycena belliarum]|uniref:Uncharacterized protein n=1 Tax=Mycena belliarum TaxID=1033014 RepID=A0AAD6UAF6_9AGAR|nr:hypothetical protein B0H15DRAFT_945824 [Mycena belliae]